MKFLLNLVLAAVLLSLSYALPTDKLDNAKNDLRLIMERYKGILSTEEEYALLEEFDENKDSEKNCFSMVFNENVDDDIKKLTTDLLQELGANTNTFLNGSLVHMCFRDSEAPIEVLTKLNIVQFIERDKKVTGAQVQESPVWNLERISQPDLPLGHSFNFSATGKGIPIYFIDSGINIKHPEFGSRAQIVNFKNDGSFDDCAGHGTMTAGVAAGQSVGVAKEANVIVVQALNCLGMGDATALIRAYEWVIDNAVTPGVLNLSIAMPKWQTIDHLVKKALEKGLIVVAAAGNSYSDACESSPSGVPGVITVGSINQYDEMSAFSNWGICVTLFAPGENIIAPVSATSGFFNSMFNFIDALALGTKIHAGGTFYITTMGTSFSAPMVAGVAALILEKNPSATQDDITRILKEHAAVGRIKGILNHSPNLILQNPENDPSVTIQNFNYTKFY